MAIYQYSVQSPWTKSFIQEGSPSSEAPVLRNNHAVAQGLHINVSLSTSWSPHASLRPHISAAMVGWAWVCVQQGLCDSKSGVLCIFSSLCEICECCLDLKTLSVQMNSISESAEYQTFEARKIECFVAFFFFPFRIGLSGFFFVCLFFSWRFGRHDMYNIGLWWNQCQLIKLHL